MDILVINKIKNGQKIGSLVREVVGICVPFHHAKIIKSPKLMKHKCKWYEETCINILQIIF